LKGGVFIGSEFTVWSCGINRRIAIAWVVAFVRGKQAGMEAEAAKNSAERIIEEAKKDASAIKKEAELYAKDSVLKRTG
jgi:hypothetical protein